MDRQNPQAERTFEDCLARIQQRLLAAGYAYVDGDPALDRWPRIVVAMGRHNELLILAPWTAPQPALAAELWRRARDKGLRSGLVLVGSAAVDDAGVTEFCEVFPGPVAYLDAEGRQVLLHRRRGAPEALRAGQLRAFVAGDMPPKAARIDALAAYAAAHEEIEQTEAFFARAGQAGVLAAPWVTRAIVGVCVALFAAMAVLDGGLTNPSDEALLRWGANYGPAVRGGQWWRILTCGFVHIGWVHILFNAYATHVFGSALERFQGMGRTAGIFIFSVVAASCASLFWHPMVLSAGASGGLFGLVGAIGAMIVRYRRDFPPHFWHSLRKWVVTILVYNAVFLLLPAVDGAAHVGGLIGGFLLGLAVLRSPVRRSALPVWGWAAAALLAAATVAFGAAAVARIPPGLPPVPVAILVRQAARRQGPALDRLVRNVATCDELVDDATMRYERAVDGRGDGAAAAEALERDVLPRLAGLAAESRPAAADRKLLPSQIAVAFAAGEGVFQAASDYCRALAKSLRLPPGSAGPDAPPRPEPTLAAMGLPYAAAQARFGACMELARRAVRAVR